jgi:hypothetical protein
MKDRRLRVPDWEFERMDVISVLEWIISQNPHLQNLYLPIKAYQAAVHGELAEEKTDLVLASTLKRSIKTFRERVFSEIGWLSWNTGIGNTFYNGNAPQDFIPMLDMELVSTNDLHGDLMKIENGCNKIGFTGSILRSGETGRGGFFLIGDMPRTFTPGYWKFFGSTMMNFVYGNNPNVSSSKQIGEKLYQAESFEKAKLIGSEILRTFPSISTGHEIEGLLYDPRWVGHSLERGCSILRVTPGKSYEDRPLQVAEYY